jgi:hypothetical protein
VVTRRVSGSIAVTVSRKTVTPGLAISGICHANRLGLLAPEHQVQLRKAKDERVALVDQRHLDLAAGYLRQHRAQLQTTKSRAQHSDPPAAHSMKSIRSSSFQPWRLQ